MNNDIKEILVYMMQYVENKYEHDSEPMLNYKDIKCVLDYITNLQEENERLNNIIEEKKIPEKLDVIGWDKCIHNVTHKEKELAIEINKTQKLLNQVIDFLKSKGE